MGNCQNTFQVSKSAMMGGGMNYFGMHWWWFGLISLIILLGIGWFIYRQTQKTKPVKMDSAEAILDRAFASGEISEQEYLRKKSMLQQNYHQDW